MSCRDWRANKTNKRLFPFPCWTVCPNQGVRFKGRAWERAERVAGCAAHPPCARRTRRERSGGLGLPGQRPRPARTGVSFLQTPERSEQRPGGQRAGLHALSLAAGSGGPSPPAAPSLPARPSLPRPPLRRVSVPSATWPAVICFFSVLAP